MGLVTSHLISKLARQIDQERLVVWYDPERAYEAVADMLAGDRSLLPAGSHFVRYEDSFFAVRHAVEPHIAGIEPPRLLVYVPLDRERTECALVELETLGVTMQPGTPSSLRNTRLAVVAREALKETLGEEAVQRIADQTGQGKLTLAELDALAERTEGLRGVLAAIYEGATEPTAIALAFLSRPERDAELVRREAVEEMAALLQGQTGFLPTNAEDAATLRRRFARYFLVSELAASLSGPLPSALGTVTVALRDGDRTGCVALARTFRLRRDLGAAYAELAGAVAAEMNLGRLVSSLPHTTAETFRETEQELQRRTENALLAAGSVEEIEEQIELAQGRLRGFWAEFQPDLQAQWAIVATAGQVLLQAERIAAELKILGSAPAPAALLAGYTEGDTPWCLLDTHYRHLERRWVNFDADGDSDSDSLDRLLVRARQRYSEVAGNLAETFARAFQRAHFRSEAAGLPIRQRDIFARRVRPFLGVHGEKVAYFLVDALRYEMARELKALMADDADDISFEAALGTMPTITEIGMAALMPGAEADTAILVPGRTAGKVALRIDGKVLGNRDERVQHLKETLRARHGIGALDLRLEDLVPRPPKRRETAIRQAGFLLVTSQEIDALCESGNVPLARRTVDEMLRQIRRAFRVLSDLGITRIVCAADHGHLFADELQDDMKIEAPGGETVDLHRRVWIGRGGASDAAALRAKVADFGLGSDLELVTPYNLACFKASGVGATYFHGGLSPQELVIPVLTVTTRRKVPAAVTWIWKLRPGSRRITTRFFSVTVEGVASALFTTAPPRIRLELRVHSQPVSIPVSASYGFEEATGDITLLKSDAAAPGVAETQANTVALMLTEEMNDATASLHLLDADTGVELTRLDDLAVAIPL